MSGVGMSGVGVSGLAMRVWLVRRLARSDHLDEVARHALLALPLEPRPVAARAELDGGAGPSGLHLILDGVACRSVREPGGNRRIVALFLPGDLCASRSLLPLELPGKVETLSACAVADIAHDTLRSLVRAHPGIERSLAWLTLLELGIAQRWLVNAGRDAEGRVAHLICEIVARLRAVGCREGEAFANGVRQAVIADIAGISIVHVNRVLHALQDADRIRLVKGVITVPDPDRLAAYADFDPGYLRLPEPVEPSLSDFDPLRRLSVVDGGNAVAL
ncbi:Crp/Fnr family transcriptional regulator [Methylobacterium goesingense]|uniref:CRP-like cAMP-binding protein n=1 Tax=Methylobacterium goesingense TaxID=243690 RepID=A0ABV2LA67_9HYPH|nr:Crp/Fnr family transcriptional regulator [Methylobacterium goesingense]GJD74271.1 hypothetical protein CFIICLFH_2505 [Methylobacterium goesingense]